MGRNRNGSNRLLLISFGLVLVTSLTIITVLTISLRKGNLPAGQPDDPSHRPSINRNVPATTDDTSENESLHTALPKGHERLPQGRGWKFHTGKRCRPITQVAVCDGVAYFGVDRPIGGPREEKGPRVCAVTIKTGQLLWEYEREPTPQSYLAVSHSTVYFIDLGDNALCALDAKTGRLRWSVKPGGEVRRSPAVADGIVYFYRLYAVDAITGDLKWKFYAKTRGSRVAVADGIVYFGAAKTFYALDGQTGDEVWHREIGSWVHFPCVVSDGLVYISTGKTVCALNAETGDVKWTFGPLLWADRLPVVVEGLLYLTDGPGLQVIDAQNGQHVWRFDAPGKTRALAPAVANGIVYFPQRGFKSRNKLYALDAKTGALKRTIELHASAPPSVADGLLFVPSYDGYLYAVEHELH